MYDMIRAHILKNGSNIQYFNQHNVRETPKYIEHNYVLSDV